MSLQALIQAEPPDRLGTAKLGSEYGKMFSCVSPASRQNSAGYDSSSLVRPVGGSAGLDLIACLLMPRKAGTGPLDMD